MSALLFPVVRATLVRPASCKADEAKIPEAGEQAAARHPARDVFRKLRRFHEFIAICIC
jgi:hypothetical protein